MNTPAIVTKLSDAVLISLSHRKVMAAIKTSVTTIIRRVFLILLKN